MTGMAVIPPGFAEIVIPFHHVDLAREAIITLGIDSGGQTDPELIANGVQNAFSATGSVNDRIDNSVTVGPVEARLGQDGADPLVGFASTTILGGLSQSTPPPNVAVLVTKRTQLGGRRNRGRVFVPWHADETGVGENGLLTAPHQLQLQSVWDAFRANLLTPGFDPVVLHSQGLSLIPPPTPVVAFRVEQLVSTQRRRLGRR